MNEISASPLGIKRPEAVERNCGLTARRYISTMTDSAYAARGGSNNHPNTSFKVDRANQRGLLSLARQL